MMSCVSRNAGKTEAPPAVRAVAPGWRDPRLWVGIVIVAISVVAGARLIGGADDSIGVWAAADDLGAGDTVEVDDLVARRIRFVDAADVDRYLATDDPLPADLHLLRGVGGGELLPRAALGTAEDSGVVEVPVAVAQDQVPPSVAAGSVVDVWVSAPDGPGETSESELVLEQVVVIDAPGASDGFGSTGDRQVVLGIPDDQAEQLPRALGAANAGAITIARRG